MGRLGEWSHPQRPLGSSFISYTSQLGSNPFVGDGRSPGNYCFIEKRLTSGFCLVSKLCWSVHEWISSWRLTWSLEMISIGWPQEWISSWRQRIIKIHGLGIVKPAWCTEKFQWSSHWSERHHGWTCIMKGLDLATVKLLMNLAEWICVVIDRSAIFVYRKLQWRYPEFLKSMLELAAHDCHRVILSSCHNSGLPCKCAMGVCQEILSRLFHASFCKGWNTIET